MYDRLQKVGMCLSHSCTLKLVDKLGEGFDKKVLQWRSKAEASMDTIEDAVSSMCIISALSGADIHSIHVVE